MEQNNVQDSDQDLEAISDKIVEAFKGPMNDFGRERKSGELNLVQEVRQCLIDHGAGDKIESAFNTSRFITEAETKNAYAQQFLLNRYFSLQLASLPTDTSLERYVLMNEVSPIEWLSVFRQRVVHAVVSNDLPRAI